MLPRISVQLVCYGIHMAEHELKYYIFIRALYTVSSSSPQYLIRVCSSFDLACISSVAILNNFLTCRINWGWRTAGQCPPINNVMLKDLWPVTSQSCFLQTKVLIPLIFNHASNCLGLFLSPNN